MPELDLASAPSFANAFTPTAFDGDRGTASVPPGWAQGRATFGGLVLAQAMAAARRKLPEPRPPRGIVASFPAPIGVGEVDLHVRELRHGRAASQLQVEVAQAGEVGCVVLLSFGAARPSAVEVPPPPRPVVPPPDESPPMIPAGNRTAPEFTKFYDYRLTWGDRPYAGADVRELGGWCRYRAEPGPLADEHVLGLVDAWPSPAVARLQTPAPAASMTWSLELLEVEPEIDGDGWWLYHAELEASAQGYAHSAARLWSPAGRLAALSRQIVAIFG